ncbi:MAG: ATP-binding cassette domain-containing protein [Bryobacteraceae bacterium]
MAFVEFRDVHFTFGANPVLRGVSFEAAEGETLVLLGRSGSGKSTALKLANGMLFPTAGEVRIGGRSTREWDPVALKRRTGYVIQEVGLFPHFTVERNVGLAPRLEGWDAARISARVDRLLETVGLPPAEFRPRLPRELSGGQRQRVGIARALAADPPLVLLDEPFGALDPVTRAEMQRQFLTWQADLGKTALFVTHDIREALRVGSRVILLANGRVDTAAPVGEFPRSQSAEARAFLASM